MSTQFQVGDRVTTVPTSTVVTVTEDNSTVVDVVQDREPLQGTVVEQIDDIVEVTWDNDDDWVDEVHVSLIDHIAT